MPASPIAFAAIAQKIRASDGNRSNQDFWLDVWLEYRDLATEWDADHWHLRTARLGYLVAQMEKTPFDDQRLHW